MNEYCHFCSAEATKLCDQAVTNNEGVYTVESGTCDLPVCDDCATQVGTTFDLAGPGVVDTMDYCPFHAGVSRKELVAAAG